MPPPLPGAARIIILPGVTGSEPNQFASIFGDVVKCCLPCNPHVVTRASAVCSGVLLLSFRGLSGLAHTAESPSANGTLRQGSQLWLTFSLCFASQDRQKVAPLLGNRMDKCTYRQSGGGSGCGRHNIFHSHHDIYFC